MPASPWPSDTSGQRLTLLELPEPGHWCMNCDLPSGALLRCAVEEQVGGEWRPVGMTLYVRCGKCGNRRPVG